MPQKRDRQPTPPDDNVAAGTAALAEGRWGDARDAFATAASRDGGGAAFDGLGEALWWLQRTREAVSWRERAYTAFRREGVNRRAARTALWLAAEHAQALGDAAAARGWLARARRLLEERPEDGLLGWAALVESELEPRPAAAAAAAQTALRSARDRGDAELEAAALAQLGLCRVQAGQVEAGLACCDEAITAVTAEPGIGLRTIGTVYCKLVTASELAADPVRIGQWTDAVNRFIAAHHHPGLLAFCGSCCGELFVASGQWGPAESELERALHALESSGETARCVHPAARLAELRVLQGRLDDAAALLAGHESRQEAIRPLAAVHRARGELAAAATVLRRGLALSGEDSLLAVPLLGALVEVELERDAVGAAADAAERLDRIAVRTDHARVRADADVALGLVALAKGMTQGVELLERALHRYTGLGLPYAEGRVRLRLAQAFAAEDAESAAAEARAALHAFEHLGAPRDADAAAALLRDLGVRGRTGPKGSEVLTRREQEVLGLLGEGLTNAEVARRLFISPKTAANHVSSVLAKLHLRNRAEAAAYAQRSLARG